MIEETGEHVLIVDREPDALKRLLADLNAQGCATTACRPTDLTGVEIQGSIVGVVLGPTLSPLEVCNLSRELRALVTCPLLVLGDKSSPDFLAIALDAGSDACLVGDPNESARLIVSAIRALERRDSMKRSVRRGVVEIGHLRVDLVGQVASLRGAPLPLTETEFDLLAVLVQRPGKVMSAAEILQHVHGRRLSDAEAQEIVSLHVTRLRQKLGSDPWLSRCLVSVGSNDYMYTFERRGELLVLDAVLRDDDRDAMSKRTP